MRKVSIVNHPFNKVVELLSQIPDVDGVSAGVSPITFRWLTKENTYVNVGLTEVKKFASVEAEQRGEKPTEEFCEIAPNVNSYEVKDSTVEEIHRGVCDFITKWDAEQATKATKAQIKEDAEIKDIQDRNAAKTAGTTSER